MKTLREVKKLNVAKELKGMEIFAPLTDEKLGVVVDALIHPIEGNLISVLLQTPQNEVRTLAATDLEITHGAIRVAEDAVLQSGKGGVKSEGAYTTEDIIGALVITDSGGLLGRVSEVYVSVATRRTYYRIIKSEWERLIGGGLFIAGDVPHSYFHRNHRLIVPADTEGRYATKSLAETA